MTPLTIVLPLPPKECSPNWRGHWAKKRIAVHNARTLAWAHTHQLLGHYVDTAPATATWASSSTNPHAIPQQHIRVSLTFILPDNRRRDTDNLYASCKAYFDGISDALRIDDSRFELRSIGRTVQPGVSEVRIEVNR